MALKYLSHLETLNIDMQGYELQNAVIHTLTTATRPGSPSAGQIIYNSSTGSLEVFDGSGWVSASGDITSVSVSSGAGLTGSASGTSGAVSGTIALDYAGSDNFILAAGAGTGDISTAMHIAVSDASNNVDYYDVAALPFTDNTGTVTSVGGTGTVSGLTLTGTVTTSGNLTLGGTLVLTSSQVTTALGYTPYDDANPDGFTSFAEPGIFSGGGTPTLASGVTAAEIRSLIGAGTSSTTGTVTSVAVGGNDGITVSGSPITSSGTISLGLADLSIQNAKLANSQVTFGSTTVGLGGTSTSIAGLTALDFAAGDRVIGASIGANNLTLGAATSTVVIPGDLRVDGTTTQVNSNEVNIGDAIITLNADETGAPSQNAGFEVERGTSANVSLVWDETLDRWDFGAAYDVRANAFIGDLEGTADDASKWTIARTITLGGDASGSVSIDGSANVTLTVSVDGVSANSVALGTDTTGDYVAGVTGSGAISVTGSGGEGSTPAISVANAATNAKGVVELATSQEAITGTDTARAVTPKAASDLVANRQAAMRVNDVIPAGTATQAISHGFGSTFGVVAGAAAPIIISYFDTVTGEQLMIDSVQVTIDDVEARLAAPHANDIFVSIMYAGA
jgi:hypothetical protein